MAVIICGLELQTSRGKLALHVRVLNVSGICVVFLRIHHS